MVNIWLLIVGVIGVSSLYALYQRIRDAILGTDATRAEAKQTLLDTVIQSQQATLTIDEQKAKEAFDAYHAAQSNSSTKPDSNS